MEYTVEPMSEVTMKDCTNSSNKATIHFVGGDAMQCDAAIANVVLGQITKARVEVIRIDDDVIFTRNIARISFGEQSVEPLDVWEIMNKTK